MTEAREKGVIIEFDFAAMDGAGLLYRTAEALLGEIGVPFGMRVEAQHFVGSYYQGAFSEYFAAVKSKKTAAKAAKDLSDRFREALNTEVPKAVNADFTAFVRRLLEKGVKVVVSTRADVDLVREAFAPLASEGVVLYQESSPTYGCLKWDAWRQTCVTNKLRSMFTVAVTGSGYGVKSALVAGLGAVAVMNDHVAWQDYGGADDIVQGLDAKSADAVLDALHI